MKGHPMSPGRRVRYVPVTLTAAQKERVRDVPRGLLLDADTGETVISATFEYIEQAIRDRGYQLVRV
jgi:hypothetical protein